MLAWTKQNTMQRAMWTVLEWPQSHAISKTINMLTNKSEPQQKCCLGTVSKILLGGLNRFYRRLTSPSASIMAQNIQLFGPREEPEYTGISSLLTYVSDHHERQTRSTTLDLLHIPRSHSTIFDRAFSVQGPKLWIAYQRTIETANLSIGLKAS